MLKSSTYGYGPGQRVDDLVAPAMVVDEYVSPMLQSLASKLCLHSGAILEEQQGREI